MKQTNKKEQNLSVLSTNPTDRRMLRPAPTFLVVVVFRQERFGLDLLSTGARGRRFGSPATTMALVDDVGGAVFFSAGGGAATGALDPIAALIDPA